MLNLAQIRQLKDLRQSGKTLAQVHEITGLSITTIMKYTSELSNRRKSYNYHHQWSPEMENYLKTRWEANDHIKDIARGLSDISGADITPTIVKSQLNRRMIHRLNADRIHYRVPSHIPDKPKVPYTGLGLRGPDPFRDIKLRQVIMASRGRL